MAKLVKVSPTKAYRIEAIQIGEEQMISIRQMYATKKDPAYKPGRQGLTIPIDTVERIAKHLKNMADDQELEFVEVQPRAKGDD